MVKTAERVLVKITDNIFEGHAGLFCVYPAILSASYKAYSNSTCVCVHAHV